MQKQLSRLAVAQVILIVYAVLSSAVFLRMRYGTASPDFVGDAPYGNYVLWIKHFGFCLLLIPAIWGFYSLWRLKKPDADEDTFSGLYLSGAIIAVGLVVFGLSTAAVMAGPIVEIKEKPASNISGSRFDKVDPASQP